MKPRSKPRGEDSDQPSNDPVSNPKHYELPESLSVVEQSIDVAFACGWGPSFCKGNVFKYLTRASKKEGESNLKDLKKARMYVDFLINYTETGHPRRVGSASE